MAEVRAEILRPRPMVAWRRRIFNWLGWGLSGLAFVLLGGAMVWILEMVFARGVGAMNWTVLSTVTNGVAGGLLQAIEGTAVLAVGGIVLSLPPGLAAGIYLAEFPGGKLTPTIRFMTDVLVGVPSIVVGYFAYVTLVMDLGWHFSVAAASIALAIISLPYIVRTSEVAIRQVPNTLREAGHALGATPGKVIMRICVPMALPSIMTGVLLALAIGVGETAPLLYTAGWSSYMWNGKLTHEPIGYLTYAIWVFITQPEKSAHALAYAAAFFVTFFVLLISVASRAVLYRRSGMAQRA